MKSKLIRFIIIALLALSFVINFPWFSHQIFAQTPVSSLLQQGLNEYQSDRFPEALIIWQKALQQTENTTEKALIYNYLSLVQQHLGQWEEAQMSIDRALELLPQNNPDLQARILNSQGQLYWSLGQPENALKQWQKATLLYYQADRIDGAIGTGINQAQALQVLGFGLQAETQLQDIKALIDEQLNESSLKVATYQKLGKVWRQIGKLEESENILQIATNSSFAGSEIWLELGNTKRALSDRAIIFGNESGQYTKDALNSYQKAIELAKTDALKVQAELNQLSFLIELGREGEAIALQQKLQPLFNNLPLSRSSIEAQLNFTRSLICLWDRDNPNNVPGCSSRQSTPNKSSYLQSPPDKSSYLQSPPDKSSYLQSPPYKGGLGGISTGEQIARNLAEIVERSQTLRDRLAESSARGLLGEMYERTGQWLEARNLTQEALQLAENSQALDLRYRWEWQLGRLLRKQGQPKSAIAAYKASVKTLSKLRSHLLPIDTNIQFNFRDNIEPVYRELVDLLITEDAENKQSQKEAVGLIDELQLAELENFLHCQLSPTFSIDENLESLDRKTALVYPVLIRDKLVIFSKFPEEEFNHYIVTESRKKVEEVAQYLQDNIIKQNDPEGLKNNATLLYNWLLKPIENEIKQNQIQTIVFVLDGFLRKISMSVLYDADLEEFVLQKPYNISVLPNLQVFDLKPLSDRQFNVLGAGISEQRKNIEGRDFAKLEYVEAELKIWEELNQNSKNRNNFTVQTLLNSEFSLANLEEKLRSQPFSILHLATHGEFSSDLDNTFILAHGELLKINQIKRLIEVQNARSNALLDLLVLSACKTATGDDRAILGMSGVAVRSGARSTLSTLWQVDDRSTTLLMKKFYEKLAQPDITKAKALHEAQLELFNKVDKHPYFWGGYVLIGNWL
ncbi:MULTISPECIES: CHAT domain-containing protein [Spirulina sp. CCY15215]|uniref:CHAT domain-containing protein n=1 Tax=Spirulina sp. CCY15215 TaxID=2767591 RepID=UPI001950C4E2|nr:CHAT domain-containing protein [Spirulina major]